MRHLPSSFPLGCCSDLPVLLHRPPTPFRQLQTHLPFPLTESIMLTHNNVMHLGMSSYVGNCASWIFCSSFSARSYRDSGGSAAREVVVDEVEADPSFCDWVSGLVSVAWLGPAVAFVLSLDPQRLKRMVGNTIAVVIEATSDVDTDQASAPANSTFRAAHETALNRQADWP